MRKRRLLLLLVGSCQGVLGIPSEQTRSHPDRSGAQPDAGAPDVTLADSPSGADRPDAEGRPLRIDAGIDGGDGGPNEGDASATAAIAAFAGAATIPPGSPASPISGSAATFLGGRGISNVNVIAVFWTANVNASVVASISQFLVDITHSTYFDILDEYDTPTQLIGRGSAPPSITITPSNANTSLTETDIGSELGQQIRSNVLPAPDSNTTYMVYFPPGIRITAAGCGISCVSPGFCGCHENTSQTINSRNVSFPFGIIPDLTTGACATGCGVGTTFQNATLITSHVLAETVTDPINPTGWTPEIGDPCNQVGTTITSTSGTTYTVQKLSSNVAGACVAQPPTTIGVFRPDMTEDQWLLRNSNSAGNADNYFLYGGPGDRPVVGDWNGSGARSVGVFRPVGTSLNPSSAALWYLHNTNAAGNADIIFAYGEAGDLPVAGDWTGSGTTTIGLYRPAGSPLNQTTTAQWLLRNSNAAGNPDISFFYGGPGDLPVVGDWDGNGTTTIGLFRPAGSPSNNTTEDQWLLRNSNSTGNADLSFSYGGPGDQPVVGDWNGSGTTTIGVFRPGISQDQWLLRNSNSAGKPNISFLYGGNGDLPVVGNWRRHS
jgi:hypothetical protein